MSGTASPGEAVVLTVVCTDDDPRSFCRHLTAALARTPWTLSKAFAVARQVHPQHPDALGAMATLMHCEFRLGDQGEPIDEECLSALTASLAGYETFGLQRLATSSIPVVTSLLT